MYVDMTVITPKYDEQIIKVFYFHIETLTLF